MESKYGQAHRIWVMDRGMVSEANLAFLRSRGGSYIVGTPKSMLRQFEQHLTDKDWHEVQEGVEVKLIHGFRLFEDFSYQRYGVVSRGNENGYIASSGLGHYLKVLKLSSTGEFYYGKSFGGKVYGGLIEWTDKYFEEFDIQTSLDISRYSKITNQTDTAISLVGGVDYQFVDCCSFGLGGEFNHNNWFSKEGRVTVRLVVGGGGSPRPEVSLRSPRLMRQFHEI